VERLNSTSKTSIPGLALMGLLCLSAASVRAASRLLGRACASDSNSIMAGASDWASAGSMWLRSAGAPDPQHALRATDSESNYLFRHMPLSIRLPAERLCQPKFSRPARTLR
jgi:hypothetical protein